MRMQEDLGILVLDGDRVVVPQLYSPDGQVRSRETRAEQKVSYLDCSLAIRYPAVSPGRRET